MATLMEPYRTALYEMVVQLVSREVRRIPAWDMIANDPRLCSLAPDLLHAIVALCSVRDEFDEASFCSMMRHFRDCLKNSEPYVDTENADAANRLAASLWLDEVERQDHAEHTVGLPEAGYVEHDGLVNHFISRGACSSSSRIVLRGKSRGSHRRSDGCASWGSILTR